MDNNTAAARSVLVNENKVRLVAFWVLLLVTLSLWAAALPIFIFLAFDFFLRSFGYGKYSPLAALSDVIIRSLVIASKPIYFAPKRFAARIGFLLCLLVIVSLLFKSATLVLAGSIIFATFAFLESVLGFCAGCYVYSFLMRLKMIKQ